jgi:hypothetical protein
VPNNSVVVPVELIAQGSENSAGFSLSYDSGLLYNPQVALGAEAATASLVFNNSENGKIGVIVALPAGQTFFAGTRRVVNITFQTAQTNLYSTALSFVNQPIAGEVSDANANTLPATFENRIVTFAHGFESDVAPRPTGTGNGTVTVADFTQIGKFVAGTAAPDQLNEFQRADSAPRGTKGNGVLTVSDYTQAGRYAAGLDTVQSAGGAHEALSLLRLPEIFENQNQLAEQLSGNNDFPPRAIRVVNAQTAPGQQVLVSIEMDAQGDENAAGFTLNYDSSKLSNPLVTLGAGATGATLIPNTTQTGKVGVVIGLPAGQKLQAGTQQIVTVRFDVSANAAGGQSALTFSNAPVFREVVDANADVLATSFTNGMVNILGPTSATVTIGGRIATRTGRAVSKATIMLIDSSGSARFATSNASDHYSFTEVTACETYILSVSSKRYVFNPSSQIVTINEDRDDINFTAEMKLL